MKAVHLIAPAIALAIAGGVIGAQRQKISRLETESVFLRKHITAERSRIEIQRNTAIPVRTAILDSADEKIDWLEIAGVYAEMRNGGGVGNMRKMMSFQTKLQKMDKNQLLAALDQIQALELDEEARRTLESMLVGPLAQKDPELVLNRFSDRLNDETSGMGWQLASALGVWAKKDRAAAIAWFDKEIAAGTFDSKSLDGKSHIRLSFETNLITELISTDLAAAEARLAALPADQRKDLFSGFGFQRLKGEDQAAYANLVRTNLSEEERYEVFGQQASMIAMMGNLDKVDAYLDGIDATGKERIKAAEKAALRHSTKNAHESKVSEEKLDSMREWLRKQAPGSVDRVTGESLGQFAAMSERTELPEVAALVLKYHGQGGNDDLLIGFLENTYHRGEPEELRKIAEKISDPQKRGEALEKLK